MKRLFLVAVLLCSCLLHGCGGDKNKDVNKDKDRQKTDKA
jgi:hypothetical protein